MIKKAFKNLKNFKKSTKKLSKTTASDKALLLVIFFIFSLIFFLNSVYGVYKYVHVGFSSFLMQFLFAVLIGLIYYNVNFKKNTKTYPSKINSIIYILVSLVIIYLVISLPYLLSLAFGVSIYSYATNLYFILTSFILIILISKFDTGRVRKLTDFLNNLVEEMITKVYVLIILFGLASLLGFVNESYIYPISTLILFVVAYVCKSFLSNIRATL